VSCSDCGRKREKTFHAVLQEFPEIATIRAINKGTAIPIKKKGFKHKSFQKQSLSPVVYVYVDFSPT
jgi:hypothetical protein